MQKKLLPLALLAALAAGCQKPTHSDGMSTGVSDPKQPASAARADGEEEISLDEVPPHVLQAALAAVPGLVIEEAELETEQGVTVYCLEGNAGGETAEVEVTPDGRVVEVEHGDDDEDEGDDDDDDDEAGDDD